jgi:hypothetical protein
MHTRMHLLLLAVRVRLTDFTQELWRIVVSEKAGCLRGSLQVSITNFVSFDTHA